MDYLNIFLMHTKQDAQQQQQTKKTTKKEKKKKSHRDKIIIFLFTFLMNLPLS